MLKNLIGAIALAFPLATPAQPNTTAPLKVGFVYVSPVGQAGWTFQHDQGRREMERTLGAQVSTTVVEGVPEGADAERVLRDLALQGHRLIFATSFGYLEPALRVAADFPQVKFEHAGGYKTAPNLNTYNARYYEGRYLAGLVAGRSSRSGIAGYVAGFPVPEVIQGINAFTLGMRAANPNAQVRVTWLNTWFDPAREREAALALVAQSADVLTNHSASPAVAQAAEDKGVKLLAYQSDMSAFAPHAQLAAVTHHWGGYYTQVARGVIDGRWAARPVWGGMKDGFVRLSAIAPSLPKAVRDEVAARRQAIEAGRLKPFSGRLVDNAGRVRLEHGALDDAAIAAMDWFVQGVATPAQK
ncbi:BMP family ABC transporter substrate-binding protein [Ideonella sp. BN130291]|uniref:BMP family ABC transporter substrate-binding protein n=1 Tax=Ideonella sp. BN130291 TaxID=3112940 RepID=UPI002E25C207|nr:BMP family ABC transporter substrate-binding protein [Ideonella sp. BN130291]